MGSAPQLGTADDKVTPEPGARFVARQPILTRDEQVFGYELLFRDGVENYFRAKDLEAAARSTLDSSLLLGLDVLCGGRRAFVNCTRDVLVRDFLMLLPSNQTVAEILECVEPDDQVLAACQRLKENGYMIALDDFAENDPRAKLTDFADIIKVDVRRTTPEQRVAMVKQYGPWRCRMLAEKVETWQEFIETRNAGFLYFQGFFFQHPEIVATKEIPVNQMSYLRMLQAVAQTELDHKEIENVIKSEASLCYRLLRYMNSVAFSLSTEVHSVRHALSLLGEREVRRWVRLIAMIGAGKNKSSELVLTALVRARFCELLSPKVPHGDSDLFFMGLLSVMDALLELPMTRIVEMIPLDHEMKTVLSGGVSILRPVYQLMLARESGEWEQAIALQKQLLLNEEDVAQFYWQAMQWAKEMSSQ